MIYTGNGETLALYIILRFFESAMLCLLLEITLCKKWDFRWYGAIVCMSFLLIQLIRGIIGSQSLLGNTALNIGSDFIVICVFYSDRLRKKLSVVFLFYIMMTVCDGVTLIIAAFFDRIEPEAINTIESIPVFVVILSRCLLPILTIAYSKIQKKSGADIIKPTLLVPILAFTATLLIAFFPIGSDKDLSSMSELLFFTASLLLTVALVAFLASLLRYIHREGMYNRELYEENQRLKAVKHDLNNHISTAESLGDSDYMETLRKRMDEMLIDTGNHVVNTVLFNKQSEMKSKCVSLEVTGILPKFMSWLEPVDISTILGNALDNAAEATVKLEPDEREPIEVRLSHKGGMIVIIVKNKALVDNDLDFKSTKKERGHGYGIQNINEAVSRYDGHMELVAEDGWVSLSVLLQVPV